MKTKYFWWIGIFLIVFFAAYLRIYRLTEVPPSPYWEEVALGYDAYSLLKTGKDHHGNPWPVVALESFGDWKPALYAYSIIPSVAIFGLTVFAIRLPSALAGVMTVLGIGYISFWLTKEFEIKNRYFYMAIAMLVSAISPWMLIFSRAAWEVNLATAFMTWGAGLGLMAVQKKESNIDISKPKLLASVLLLIASLYTYHSARITAPLLGIGLLSWWIYVLWVAVKYNWQACIKKIQKSPWFYVIGLVVMSVLLVTPLLSALKSPVILQRANETSIFADMSVIEFSNAHTIEAGQSLFSRLWYHRYILYLRVILEKFLSHFDIKFLFLQGDSNLRHSVQYVGQLYHVELIFILIGIGSWLNRKSKAVLFFWWWLVVGILPASLTTATPHSLRILPATPIFYFLITQGIFISFYYCQKKLSSLLSFLSLYYKKIWFPNAIVFLLVITIFFSIYFGEFLFFWRYYQKIYPIAADKEWQFGYQELVKTVEQYRIQNPNLPIYITREQGRPAMYYWFFTQTDPKLVQAENSIATKDQGEFLSYKNIQFIRGVYEVKQLPALVAASPTQIEALQLDQNSQNMAVVSTIKNPQDQIIWEVVQVN